MEMMEAILPIPNVANDAAVRPELIDEDVRWEIWGHSELSGAWTGRRAIEEAYDAQWRTPVAQMVRSIDAVMTVDGSRVMASGRTTGLHRDGAPFSIDHMFVLESDPDSRRVTRYIDYPDLAMALSVLRGKRYKPFPLADPYGLGGPGDGANHDVAALVREFLVAMTKRRSPEAIHTLPGYSPIAGRWPGTAGLDEFCYRCFLVIDPTTVRPTVDEYIIKNDEYLVYRAHNPGSMARNGQSYENDYLHILQRVNGTTIATTEWCDTDLIQSVLFS